MFTLRDLLTGLLGTAPEQTPDHPISEVVIDSRQTTPGSLFVAIRGGHQHVPAAFAQEASIALVSEPLTAAGPTLRLDAGGVAQGATQWQFPLCIQVDDTVAALQKVATYWRSRFTPNVVGITGSVGKSSTKELTYAVLAQKYQTLRNRGSYNNEIGLPFTLLQLNETHQQVVLEMGTYDVGEIASLCAIAKPNVGLVTNVGPTHLERMGTIERIAQAKRELVEALDEDGVAILNLDDPNVSTMRHHTQARVFTYGLSPEADLWADQVVSEGLEGIRFILHHGDERLHVNLPLLGQHSVHTALAATSVGLTQGMDWEEILSGLQDRQAQLRLIAVPGPHNAIILDDTYNASASSSLAALNLLHELSAGRKIAVLGDMAELGSFEEEGHRKVGRRAAETVDLLITIGQKSKTIAQEAIASGLAKGAVTCLEDKQAALAHLKQTIQERDIVLIKGSRSLQLETMVNDLSVAVAEPSL